MLKDGWNNTSILGKHSSGLSQFKCLIQILRCHTVKFLLKQNVSTDFGWDRVKFLHSSVYFGLVTKICVNNTGMFSHCWAALTQHHGLFYFSTAPPASRLGAGKKLEGDRGGQLTQGTIPYTIPYPYHTAQQRKLRRRWGRICQSGIWSGTDCTSVGCLWATRTFPYYLFFLVLFPFGFKRQGLLFVVFFFFLIKLSLTQPMSFCTFTLTSLFLLQRTEWRAVRCSAAY